MSESALTRIAISGLLIHLLAPESRAIIRSTTDEVPSQSEAATALNLRERLAREFDSIHALSLVYQQRPTSPPGKPAGGYTRRFVAAARPGFFLRDNSHGHSAMDWGDDPFRKTLLKTPDAITLKEELSRVVTDIDPKYPGATRADVQGELTFRALCWWPLADWEPPSIFGRPWSMPALMRRDDYTLRERIETIDGIPCHVLEVPGVDVLWLSVDNPSCVIRRAVYNPDTRSIASQFDMRGYSEVMAGIWMPARVVNRQFDSFASTQVGRNRVVVEGDFDLTQVRVNAQVAPSVFRLDYGSGAIRRVRNGASEHYEAASPGQADFARSLSDWCRRYAERGPASSANRATGAIPAAAFGLSAGGIACLIIGGSHRKRRPASPPVAQAPSGRSL